MTKREEILQFLVSVLGGISGVQVFRSRVSAFLRGEGAGVPVLLTWTSDIPDQKTLQFLDWTFSFKVDVLGRGDAPDTSVDAYVAAIHAAIMSDPTLSGLTMDIEPASTELQSLDVDNGASVVRLGFTATYRTALRALDA